MFLFTGVNLTLNESVFLTEGKTQNICVAVDNYEQSRERNIPISLSVTLNSVTSGMCSLAMSKTVVDAIYNSQVKVISTLPINQLPFLLESPKPVFN